jgi:hypothetical protein
VEGKGALSTLEGERCADSWKGNIRACVSPASTADSVSFDAPGRPRPTRPTKTYFEERYEYK